jgi:hypothetical protein
MMYRVFIAVIITLISASALFSQGLTTAQIDGTVTDENGQPLAGVTVKAVHQPTGTVAGSFTNEKGRYTLPGLRIGGPYEITYSMVGLRKETINEIYLSINQDVSFDIKLYPEDVEMDEITVLGNRDNIISSGRTGAAQTVTEVEIERLPTIERSLSDYTRLTPQIVGSSSDGSSAAGRNSKFNNIQVDGASLNDGFGLDAAGTPGGQVNTQPISLDAIQEFQVAIAPYDVRQSDFTGAYINAVTRSGSNRFTGSVYSYGRNQALVGNNIYDEPYNDFRQLEIGGRLGGPVVEDKLFFFLSGEVGNRVAPRDVTFNNPDGGQYNLPVDQSILGMIADISKEKWGYDPGEYTANYSVPNNNYKIFARFDYNINDKHRLTLRHNFVYGFEERGVNRYSTNYSYGNSAYDFNSMQNQTVLQLNSVFSKTTFNELKIAITSVNDARDPKYQAFPYVRIRDIMGTDLDVNMGIEQYSQANSLDQTYIEITDNFNWVLGNHNITFGTQNQIFGFNNLFLQNYYGAYEFASLEDFSNGIVSRYYNSYSLDVDKYGEKPRADWTMMQSGIYIQDEWSLLRNLKISYGLRGDYIFLPDEPYENEILTQEFSDLSTTDLPSMFLLSPRVGFNWDIFDDKKSQIRGGLGIFSGRTPGVWLSNQYSNTGVDVGRVDAYAYELPEDFRFVPDPYNQPRLPGDPTTEVNLVDPDFKMPQLFRTSLGIDQKLGKGFIGTIDYMYSKTINDVYFLNYNREYARDESGNIEYAPDGRPLYTYEEKSDKFTNIIYMTNTDEGYQSSLTFQLRKQWGQGILPKLGLNMSYTYTDAKDINSNTSSIAYSNWRYLVTQDPNNPKLATSDFEIPHRILFNVSYKFEWFKGLSTIFGLYYEGRSGSPFSFVYRVPLGTMDPNYDLEWSNDLAYIPSYQAKNDAPGYEPGTDPNNVPDVILSTGNWQEFEDFISGFSGIDEQRGKIIDRNSLRSPWQNQVDLRITQDVKLFNSHKFQLTFDFLNLLNMFNKEWGQIEYVRYNSFSLVTFEGYEVDPRDLKEKPVIDFSPEYFDKDPDGNPTPYTRTTLSSRWQMQFGLRYFF